MLVIANRRQWGFGLGVGARGAYRQNLPPAYAAGSAKRQRSEIDIKKDTINY